MTLVIDNPTVEKVLTPREAIGALEDAHREMAYGRAINSPPYRVLTPRNPAEFGDLLPRGSGPVHHSFTSLTGAISSLDITCDRVDSDFIAYFEQDERLREVRISNAPNLAFCGLLFLYSSRTGELLSIIHDGYAQKFRVAGTAAVGSKYLARENPKTMALIGTGWQAQAAVLCHSAIFSLTQIRVYSPTAGHKEAFAERWSAEAGVPIIPVNSPEEAVREADIIITATNAPEPVISGEWLEPGQFVTGVKDLELDLAGWERCDVLVANRHGPMWMRYAVGGVEVIPEHGRDYWGKPSKIKWEELPLLGDAIIDKHRGRTHGDQIAGLLLRGDGVQFAAIGARIYQLCKARGLGYEIPTELFMQDHKYIP